MIFLLSPAHSLLSRQRDLSHPRTFTHAVPLFSHFCIFALFLSLVNGLTSFLKQPFVNFLPLAASFYYLLFSSFVSFTVSILIYNCVFFFVYFFLCFPYLNMSFTRAETGLILSILVFTKHRAWQVPKKWAKVWCAKGLLWRGSEIMQRVCKHLCGAQ